MPINIKSLLRRISAAENHRDLFKPLYESAYELAIPHRVNFRNTTAGASNTQKIYSSVGITATDGFVARLQNEFVPIFSKWFELVSGDSSLNGMSKDEYNKLLEGISDYLTTVLNSSNFYNAVGEMFYDLAVGTGCLLILEGDNIVDPIKVMSVPMHSLAIDENAEGKVTGVFRTISIVARNVIDMWPDAEIPAELKNIINESPEKEIELKEATYVEKDDDDKDALGYKTIWCYQVIYKSESILLTRKYEVCPWVIVRWSKISGEAFGRGVVLKALPDLKMLNKGKELSIRAAMLNVFGVYTVADRGVMNPSNITIQPLGMIPVERNGGPNGPSIAPLPSAGNFNAEILTFDKLEMSINKIMYNKALPNEDARVRTATELVQKMQELKNDIGASNFGRLWFEFSIPAINRCLHILSKKGLLPMDIKIDNLMTKLKISSPIARNQAIEDVNSLVNADQVLKGIDPSGSLSGLTFKVEEIGSWVAEKLGVSQSLLLTEEDRQQKKAQMAAAAQQMAMAQDPSNMQ